MFPWGIPLRLLLCLLVRFSNKIVITNATGMHVAVTLTYPKHHASYFIKTHVTLCFWDSSCPPSRGATSSQLPSMQNPWLLALQQIRQTFDLKEGNISHCGNYSLQPVSARVHNRLNSDIPLVAESKRGSKTIIYWPILDYLCIGVFVGWITCLKFNYLPGKMFDSHITEVKYKPGISYLFKCTCFQMHLFL